MEEEASTIRHNSSFVGSGVFGGGAPDDDAAADMIAKSDKKLVAGNKSLS